MNDTLDALAARALERDSSLDVLEYEGSWYKWGDMQQVADKLKSLIEASGADQRAPIAFAPRNRPSAVAALVAMLSQGRTIKMIYAFQSAAGIARDVGRLKPAVFLAAESDFSDEVLTTLRAEGIAGMALREMDVAPVAGCEKTTRAFDPEERANPRIEILTSGTTGPPKQFPLKYETIARYVTAAGVISPVQDSNLATQTPMLLFMPLGNISGIYSTVPPVLRGLRISLVDRFTVATWHAHMLRYRPTVTGLPPAGVQMVLDANIPREDLASVRTLATGAAPLDPTVQRAFEERYGIPILLSYGATEFAGPVTAMTADLHAEWGARKFGSVGRAFLGAQLRVIDPETEENLPAGKAGILEVISPRIGPDWIRTSDIAVLDEDGFMFHRGRLDGAIMRGGFKLLPETIERALLLHPAMSAAGVMGVPDRRLGQVPAAAIQVKPGFEPPSVAELEAHLREHVLATHIPLHWKFVDELPKTPSFKIDRPALRRLLEE